MTEAVLALFRHTLPAEIANLVQERLTNLEQYSHQEILGSSDARLLFGHEDNEKTTEVKLADFETWTDYIFHRLGILLGDRTREEGQYTYFSIGYSALLAFIQSNVTGPPLPFSSAKLLLPHDILQDKQKLQALRRSLIASLGIDGIAAYRLTPNVELLCLADAIMTTPPILKNITPARWAKMRVTFFQQRLLSETSSTLQNVIYDDIEMIELQLRESDLQSKLRAHLEVQLLLERAAIHTYHGLDKLARKDLDAAKLLRRFEFALTGLLGKRTKYQEKDISQLVVLAKSAENDVVTSNGAAQEFESKRNGETHQNLPQSRPKNLHLNDDTLLEAISFTSKLESSTEIQDVNSLPPSLKALDPSSQPQLEPIDSVILLSLASSITNTSPVDGLTREETLPYATRVLEGGSSNWQVYTQALLVRSRIEGYKSRTIERGLLQLQALVDQVTADTTSSESESAAVNDEVGTTTFMRKAKESESASVSERSQFIFQLATPARWDLEAELAVRWVQLGGLRSALEIYERLEMWAEAALCWAATDREDKARKVVMRQLYKRTNGGADSEAGDDESWEGTERDPPPADAPRLYCILGDLDQSVEMYEKAWQVSHQRYARAQRSLGRYYFSAKDHVKAAAAYSKSLRVNQLNHTSWFALGCALLELLEFDKAVEAFTRCVQLDEQDAEAWSNLAAALLRSEPNADAAYDERVEITLDDESDSTDQPQRPWADPERNKHEALNALKRAATLKRESHRIWENVLIVAASLKPPDFPSILAAQKQLIALRAPAIGEKAIDAEILELLIRHIMSAADTYDPNKPGLERMAVKLVDENVIPLITASAPLWQLVAKLALWRCKPSSALEAEEKAWRAIASQPGWETDSEKRWDEVVEATARLCDAYASLGPKDRTEGMGAGGPVAKDWKFKARSAIRGIMGRGKDSWDDTAGWDRLNDAMESMKVR